MASQPVLCLALLLASVSCILQSVSGQTITMSYVDVSSSLDTDSYVMDTISDTIMEPTATLSIMDSIMDITFTSAVVMPTPISTPLSFNLSSLSADCPCDLCVGSCDLDCCCDNDCSTFEIASFSQCIDRLTSTNTEICISAEAIFRSSFTSTSASRLFCVLTDNYPGRLQFSQPQYITTTELLTQQLASHTSPGDISSNTPSLLLTTSTYRSGDPVQVSFASSSRGFLSLPAPLNSRLCHDGNPITYLSDASSTCERRWQSLEAVCTNSSALNALNYFFNFSIYGLPSSSLTPITLGSYTCRNSTGDNVSCDSSTPSTPEYNTSASCENVLLELSYTIRHNGSQGITSVTADIVIGQIDNDVTSLQQSFSVRFLLDGEVDGASTKRSGNPGYGDGRPILGGVLEGDAVNVSSDTSEWVTVMMGGGVCQVGGARLNVQFREDLRTACILNVNTSEVTSGDCASLREQTLQILWAGSLVDQIGIYGNSDSANVSQWISLLSTPPATTSECQSVVTGIQLLILYSFTGSLSSPQGTITGAELRYFTQDLQQPVCSGISCSTSSTFPITLETSVTFIPTYSPPSQVLRSTTTNVRTLPQDFLYPFFIPSSAHMSASCWKHIITILVLLTLFL